MDRSRQHGLDQLVARLAVLGVDEVDVKPDTFAYFDGGQFDDLATLLSAVERSDPTLVVVDSLIGLLALAAVETENDNAAVRKVLQRLSDVLNRRGPRTLVVVDHTGHERGRARGASSKSQWADQVVEVSVAGPWALVQQIPSLAVFTELHRLRYANLAQPWTSQDYHDVKALSVALSYCDAVCTDQAWAHVVKRSQFIADRGVVVVSGHDALSHALNQMLFD